MVENVKRKGADQQQQPTTVKRQRVSRACDQCRAAREKCDGIQPTCFTCISSNRACSYTTPPRKRGIQPGYIRTLELTLAWLFEHVPESESHLQSAMSQDAFAFVLTGKDTEASARLQRIWRKSASCKVLERLLGSVKPELELDAESGPDDDVQERPNIPPPERVISGERQDLPHRVRLPRDFWRLLDIYFAYTHNWLPLVQKHETLRLTYAYGDAGLDLRNEKDGQHAELWAMFAVASMQDENASSLSISQRTSATIYEVARGLVPDERSPQTTSHVKALILLALINIGAQKWTAAWLLLGQAISVAIDLELHKASPNVSLRNKHIVLACFFLEVLICAHLNRASRLSSIDIATLGPVDEEGLEEWHPWSACEGFMTRESIGGDMEQRVERVPNHSLSIFNQLVMLSNSTRNGRIPPLLSFPKHLQNSKSKHSTPQLLHLHILHACCLSDISRAHDLLTTFQLQFGSWAMPAIFRIYCSLLIKRNAYMAEPRLIESLDCVNTTLESIWSTGAMLDELNRDESDEQDAERKPSKLSVRTGEAKGTNVTSSDLSRNVTGSMPSYSTNPYREQELAAAAQESSVLGGDSDVLTPSLISGRPTEEGFPLQKYNSRTSIDIDALFDEMASIDCAESANHHPIFMQNLGLAPNADLSDVLGFDFGFDPLPSAYSDSDANVMGRLLDDPAG